jgi:hypothetical protein
MSMLEIGFFQTEPKLFRRYSNGNGPAKFNTFEGKVHVPDEVIVKIWTQDAEEFQVMDAGPLGATIYEMNGAGEPKHEYLIAANASVVFGHKHYVAQHSFNLSLVESHVKVGSRNRKKK